MLIKTHLSITLFFVLLFISAVEQKILFVVVALAATFIADIDSQYSTLGRYKPFRFLQFFLKHRGFFHSLIFLFLVTMFFVLFLPVVALGFFVGYAAHLLADAFTIRGIRAFYPSKKTSSWKIKTGGRSEMALFVFFILIDLLLLFTKISSIF